MGARSRRNDHSDIESVTQAMNQKASVIFQKTISELFDVLFSELHGGIRASVCASHRSKVLSRDVNVWSLAFLRFDPANQISG